MFIIETMMQLITTTHDLQTFCQETLDDLGPDLGSGLGSDFEANGATDFKGTTFLALDTEFIRESTYWPQLCLIQLANAQRAVAVDPLAPGLDLSVLQPLLNEPRLVKVFHSGRQDLEIFWKLFGRIPAPLYDTQIAAMACGFGESAGYESLVHALTKLKIDKSSQRTNWEARPLSDQQIAYAIGDVVGLREIYTTLRTRLAIAQRQTWIAEEMAALAAEDIYRNDPQDVWRRFRTRGLKPKAISILQALAAAREETAQRLDIPRSRLLRDDMVLEIATHPPRSREHWDRLRGLNKGFLESDWGRKVIKTVHDSLQGPLSETLPPSEPTLTSAQDSLLELLKLLLKIKCDVHGVAPKLVAGKAQLQEIAMTPPDALVPDLLPPLSGWRHEVFGIDAIAFCQGALALTWDGQALAFVPIERTPTNQHERKARS